MPRVRLGVVLLIPAPRDREIDGLRRALGDSQFGRIAPHMTLLPPVNVRIAEIPAVMRVMRDAAGSLNGAPLSLKLGPPSSFRPDTDTLYLGVSGDSHEMARLHSLRERVFIPPLKRNVDWPFVPHVTIGDGLDPERIDTALSVLDRYEVSVVIDRVHVLQQERNETGERVWVPIADSPFARLAVVGRGGIEVELATSSVVDPEVSAFAQEAWSALDREPPIQDDPRPSGSHSVVVTARRTGEVVGMVAGWARDDERQIESIIVGAGSRGLGIGRQLRMAFVGTE